MRNIVFLNLIANNSYSLKSLPNGKKTPEMLGDFISALPDVQGIIPIALSNDQLDMFLPDEKVLDTIILAENRQDLLLKSLSEKGKDYDHCIYLFGDCPLMDLDLFGSMYENHLKYYADYTFADGYPLGLAPEIINSEIWKDMLRLVPDESSPVGRESIFEWIQKDINSFDIETQISPVDLRMKRINLNTESTINLLQLDNFISHGIDSAKDFMERTEELETFCRTAPNYYQIQINSSCPQSCVYCPYPGLNPAHLQDSAEMPLEDLFALLKKIEEYTPEATVSLSLWGETSGHSGIYEILKHLINDSSLNYIIETSGIGWKFTDANKELFLEHNIDWIVSLDALDEELYARLRGQGMNEALGFINFLLENNPDHIWIQAVRMKENEEDLERFYRFWKEKTENVIIQKHDFFCGALEPKKITDLSPLNRFPCWHLKREMTILLNGDVQLCREDLKKEQILGNCFQEELAVIWKKGDASFHEHCNGDYKGICKNCDEYYSFNF